MQIDHRSVVNLLKEMDDITCIAPEFRFCIADFALLKLLFRSLFCDYPISIYELNKSMNCKYSYNFYESLVVNVTNIFKGIFTSFKYLNICN